MILPDINVLIYAYHEDSKWHAPALSWWENCLNSDDIIILPEEVIFGFIRILTNPKLQNKSLKSVKAVTDLWISLDQVKVPRADSQHYRRVLHLLTKSNSRGKLTSDAVLASYAIYHRATLYSADKDFAIFPNLSWKNPLI